MKKKALDEENDAKKYSEERHHRTLYQRACETTISGTFKDSLNHGNLKHDPDKTRVSKESRKGLEQGGKIFVADSSVARRSAR